MKYKFEEVVSAGNQHTIDNCDKIELLKGYLEEIASFHFPEFNGLRYKRIYINVSGHQHLLDINDTLSGLQIDFLNNDGKVIHMYCNELGYEINNENYFPGSSEDIYMKSSIIKNNDNKVEIIGDRILELSFFYGDDVVTINCKINGDDVTCVMYIYTDVPHYKYNISEFEKKLDPEFSLAYNTKNYEWHIIKDGQSVGIVGGAIGMLPFDSSEIDFGRLRHVGIAVLNGCKKNLPKYKK